jgi:hypothetical protein
MVSTGRLHGFESLEERSLLLALDFAGTVEEVLPQPFLLRFGTVTGEFRKHAPDFLAVFRDGSRWLFDVRPVELVREEDAMVGQPFADFTWRHARKIAAERGVDDTNETAVAVVLAGLLRRAGQGPDTRRVVARTRAAAALPGPRPALPASAAAGPPPPEPGEPAGTDPGVMAGFGLFDPFGDQDESR